MKNEGAMFMFKGWVPAWMRLQPTTMLIFITFEQLKNGVDMYRKDTDTGPVPNNRDDPRPDIQQAVEARSDALARGEGGPEPAPMTEPGMFDGNSGTGGEVKNQDDTQQ